MFEPRADEMRVWSTTSPTADLREARWRSENLRVTGAPVSHRVTRGKIYQAFFIEAEFKDGRPMPLFLSTNLRIIPPAGVGAPPVAGTQ